LKRVNKDTLWDVIIVGAGPAGSTCANYLKHYNENLKVLLIDQHEFPRTKICGDGIGGYTIDILSEFGLFEKLKNENKIHRIEAFGPNMSHATISTSKFSSYPNGGYVIPRINFDSMLLNASQASGVMCEFNWRLYDADYNSNKKLWNLYLKSTNSQSPKKIKLRSKILVGADGARSVVRRLFKIPYNNSKNEAIAIRAYCRTPKTDKSKISFYFTEEILPGYGWVFQVDDTTANIGIGLNGLRYKSNKLNLKKILFDFIGDLPNGKSISIDEASIGSAILPLGSKIPQLRYKQGALIGDAGSMIDPLFGEGINYGMRAGKLLASSIANAFKEDQDISIVLNKYEASYKSIFQKRMFTNNIISKIITRPRLCEFLINGLNKNNLVSRYIFSYLN